MLDPIHLLLDGLPEHRIVDHLKDKQRFRNLSKRLQRPIEGVLLRVRVEPAEQIRSRHLLELDGRDHAQDLIPLLNHNLVIGVASGLDLPGGAVYPLAVPEDIGQLAKRWTGSKLVIVDRAGHDFGMSESVVAATDRFEQAPGYSELTV